MKEPIQLATRTIDLSQVIEIEENDDHILLIFNADDVLKLTGADAEAMRKWLDEDKRRSYSIPKSVVNPTYTCVDDQNQT